MSGKNFAINKGYFIAIVLFILLGLFFLFVPVGYSFLAYLLFASAGVTAFFLILKYVMPKSPKLFGKIYKISVYVLLFFLFCLAGTVMVIAGDADSTNSGGAEYAIVFGAGVNGTAPSRSLLARLEAALEYAEENPDTVFILSGGKGAGEDISEAECMYKWLTDAGVDGGRLIIEDKASNTMENALFSSSIIGSGYEGKICVITEVYHVTRAKLCVEKYTDAAVVVKAGYSGLPILTANYYLREAFALWYYMLIIK